MSENADVYLFEESREGIKSQVGVELVLSDNILKRYSFECSGNHAEDKENIYFYGERVGEELLEMRCNYPLIHLNERFSNGSFESISPLNMLKSIFEDGIKEGFYQGVN